MDWKSTSSLICLYTVFTNTAIDTGLSPGPQWQNISPLDCLYSIIHLTASRIFALYTGASDISPPANAHSKEVLAAPRPIERLPNQNKIRLLNVFAAFAALKIFTSADSGTWEKVLTTNSLICWAINHIDLTGIAESENHTNEHATDATPPRTTPRSRAAEISASLAFVCVANTITWWACPSMKMNTQYWLFFLASTMQLYVVAYFLSRSALRPLGSLKQLFLGILESSFLIPVWMFGYSEVAMSVARKQASDEDGPSNLQALTIIFSNLATMICLGRRLSTEDCAAWPNFASAVAFICLSAVYYLWLPHDAWAEAYQIVPR